MDSWSGGRLAVEVVRDRLMAAQHPFRLRGALIDGRLDISHEKVQQPIYVRECIFLGGISFDFLSAPLLYFEDCCVLGDQDEPAVSGDSAQIVDRVSLRGCICHGRVRLGALNCAGLDAIGLTVEPLAVEPGSLTESNRWGFSMMDATINGAVHLMHAKVVGGASLDSAKISGQVALANSELASSEASTYALSAQRCRIGESLIVGASEEYCAALFRGPVALNGTQIEGDLQLDGVRFERPKKQPNGSGVTDLDLAYASVKGDLDLSGVDLPANAVADLSQAEVTRLKLGELRSDRRDMWRSVESRLDGFRYTSCDDVDRCADWIATAADSSHPGVWLQLAGVAEAAGRPAAALRSRIRASARAANRVEKIGLGWVRYGYRPWLALVPLALIALLVGLQASHVEAQGAFVDVKGTFSSEPVAVGDCDDSEARCFNAPIFALDAVTPFSLEQVDTWRPDGSRSSGAILSKLLITATGLSWALAGVLVASVAGKLKRTG